MKTILSAFLLFAALLSAALPATASTWGGVKVFSSGTPSTSTGTVTDGANFSANRIVANQLVSTGTAPSLTATGAVLTASMTVLNSNVGITGAGQLSVISTITTRGQLDANSATGPQGKFHGGNNGTAADIRGEIEVGGTAASAAYLRYGWAGLSNTYLDNSYTACATPATDSAVIIRTVTAGTPKENLIAECDGNVSITNNLGIGTASPASKLHISSGTIWVDGNVTPAMKGASGLATLRLDDGVGAQLGYNGASFTQSGSGGTESGNFTAGTSLGVDTAYFGVKITNGLGLYSRTIAQLKAITITEVGQTYYCNDCSPKKIVITTGTSAGNFADAIGGAFQ